MRTLLREAESLLFSGYKEILFIRFLAQPPQWLCDSSGSVFPCHAEPFLSLGSVGVSLIVEQTN